jgi:RNA polymerase sigma factor (sigma-70 family)
MYRHEVPFKAWLRRVMINTLINEYKKEKIHYSNVLYVEDYTETKQYSELNEFISNIDADYIYAFINKLPPATKQVFNLYFIDDFKHSEIAALLKISEGTSKWHLNAAREKLKTMLQKLNLPVNQLNHE